MIKDILESNEEVNINDKEILALKEYFPGCFRKDGSFDVEKFTDKLKDKVDFIKEGYELNFLGKSYAKLLASTESTTVIKPDIDHNEKIENKNSENIYISGDNLDALKQLLKSYSGKIKCIYIDPPYNTGSDGFVYKDDFKFTKEDLVERLSVDEDQAQKIIDMTSRGDSSHSAWLTFMYPRLLLARDLLTTDGVIFMSIDDNEQSNLKLLCDDIFGEDNFQGMFVINSSPSAIDYGHIAKMHEYALMYSKDSLKVSTNQIPEKDKKFKYTDEKGGFNIYPLYNGNVAFNPKTRPNLHYPFYLNPNKELDNGFFEIGLEPQEGWVEVWPVVSKKDGISRVWRWGKEQKSRPNLNKEIVGYLNEDGEYRIVQKSRLDKKTIRSMLLDNNMSSRRGTAEVQDLFERKVFTFPKPVELIKQFITAGSDDDSYILDFFSGSATTAHAVFKLNAESEDGGNRKFIMVQIPEKCDEGSIAYEEGYNTINEIGIERIKHAAKKIKEEYNLDIPYGFKHYILCEPNKDTLDKIENFNPGLIELDNTILNDFGYRTIVTTWAVQDGYGLNANIKTIDLGGYTAYLCDKHIYMINPGINDSNIIRLVEMFESEGEFNPENIVLFGYSFVSWTQVETLKNNIKQLNKSEKNLKVNIVTRY